MHHVLQAALASQQGFVDGEHKQHLSQIHDGEGRTLRFGKQDGKQRVAQHACLKASRHERRKAAFDAEQLAACEAQKQRQQTGREQAHRDGDAAQAVLSGGKGGKHDRRQRDVHRHGFEGVNPFTGQQVDFAAQHAQPQHDKDRQSLFQNTDDIDHSECPPVA